jgi:hypothetical protein
MQPLAGEKARFDWLSGYLFFVAGLVLSLLPERYRRRWQLDYNVNVQRATILSGVLQLLGCLVVVIVRYVLFVDERVKDLGEAAITAGREELLVLRPVQFGMGAIALLEFVFQPLTLLLFYFAFEGGVRLCAALFTGEIVGTLPLHLVAWGEEKRKKRRAERALGPRVVDLVEPSRARDYDLRIASCRPKLNWDRLMTVAYEDEFYEIVREEQTAPPRRFVYWLRKIPEGKVIRGLHHYRPEETLQEK